jgi:general secretion pathway protein L
MTAAAAQLRVPVTQFLRWWLGELRACVPGVQGDVPKIRSRAVLVQMLPDRAVFHYLKGTVRTEIGRIDFDRADSVAAKAQLAKIRRSARRRRTDVVLCLPADCVLQCPVSLPSATRENLHEVLGFEMERFTAFKADEVLYAYRLIGGNQTESRVVVDLTMVPRGTADKMMQLAREWRLSPNIVTPAGDDMVIDRTINLLPKSPESKVGRGIRRLLAILSLIALSLGGAAIYLEFVRQARLLAAYEVSLAEGRVASLHTQELREQMSRLLDRSQYVAHRRHGTPLLVEVLDEATQRLPDDTWVTQFRLEKGQLTLSGYSGAASKLIEALEASPLLTQVRFVSPVTLDLKQGVERFNLSAQVTATKLNND